MTLMGILLPVGMNAGVNSCICRDQGDGTAVAENGGGAGLGGGGGAGKRGGEGGGGRGRDVTWSRDFVDFFCDSIYAISHLLEGEDEDESLKYSCGVIKLGSRRKVKISSFSCPLKKSYSRLSTISSFLLSRSESNEKKKKKSFRTLPQSQGLVGELDEKVRERVAETLSWIRVPTWIVARETIP